MQLIEFNDKCSTYIMYFPEHVSNNGNHFLLVDTKKIPDFDSLKIPFFLRSDNQYIVKSADFSG